jgi:hypothetical protein
MKKNLPPFKSGAACENQPSIKIKIKVAAPYVKTKTWISLFKVGENAPPKQQR